MYNPFVNKYFRQAGCFHLTLAGGHTRPQIHVRFQLYLLIP